MVFFALCPISERLKTNLPAEERVEGLRNHLLRPFREQQGETLCRYLQYVHCSALQCLGPLLYSAEVAGKSSTALLLPVHNHLTSASKEPHWTAVAVENLAQIRRGAVDGNLGKTSIIIMDSFSPGVVGHPRHEQIATKVRTMLEAALGEEELLQTA